MLADCCQQLFTLLWVCCIKVRLLFEGGINFAQSFRLCDYYSSVAFIQRKTVGFYKVHVSSALKKVSLKSLKYVKICTFGIWGCLDSGGPAILFREMWSRVYKLFM